MHYTCFSAIHQEFLVQRIQKVCVKRVLARFPLTAQMLHYLLRIGDMPVSNRDEANLHRRYPDGKRSRRMLNENADEAFQRATNRAVNDNGRLLLTVLIDVRAVEAAWQLEVKLNRAQLPRSAEGIFYQNVSLWPIKCAISLLDDIISLARVLIQDAAEHCLGFIPRLQIADISLWPRTQAQRILHAENLVEEVSDLEDALEFILDLIFHQENVGIILLEFLCSQQPM